MKPTLSPNSSQYVFPELIQKATNRWTIRSGQKLHEFKWMLKSLPVLAIAFLSGCSQGDDLLPQDPLEQMDHRIEFNVARAKDYSEDIFDGAKASLHLTISLENMQNGNNTVLWDTVFTMRQLREFPAPNSPLLIRKEISQKSTPNMVLRLSQSIAYSDRNNATWMTAKGETIPRDQAFIRVDIGL